MTLVHYPPCRTGKRGLGSTTLPTPIVWPTLYARFGGLSGRG